MTIYDIAREAGVSIATVSRVMNGGKVGKATRIKAQGAYTGKDTWIVMCVVNTTQSAALASIIQRYPDTFAMMSPVGGVMGNFKKLSETGKPVPHILDGGDGQTI